MRKTAKKQAPQGARTKFLQVRVSEDEHAAIMAAAERAGYRSAPGVASGLSAYLRNLVLEGIGAKSAR